MKRREELVREFTVNIPQDVYVRLSRLQLYRVEQNFRPREATRSAIICDAIREMADRLLTDQDNPAHVQPQPHKTTAAETIGKTGKPKTRALPFPSDVMSAEEEETA